MFYVMFYSMFYFTKWLNLYLFILVGSDGDEFHFRKLKSFPLVSPNSSDFGATDDMKSRLIFVH